MRPLGDPRTESPLDLRMVARSVRWQAPALALIVLLFLGLGVAYSVAQPTVYKSTARVQIPTADAGDGRDSGADAETAAKVADSAAVAERVVDALDGQLDLRTVQKRTSASSLADTLVSVTGRGPTAAAAQALAAATAEAFVAYSVDTERSRIETSIAGYQSQIDVYAAEITEFDTQIAELGSQIDLLERGDPERGSLTALRDQLIAQRSSVDEQRTELNTRQLDLEVELQLLSAGYQQVETARLPESASSPTWSRNIALALALGLAAAVVTAIAREQVRPKARSRLDIARAVGVPVIGTIRTRRRRGGGIPVDRAVLVLPTNLAPGSTILVAAPTGDAHARTLTLAMAQGLVARGQTVQLIEAPAGRRRLPNTIRLSTNDVEELGAGGRRVSPSSLSTRVGTETVIVVHEVHPAMGTPLAPEPGLVTFVAVTSGGSTMEELQGVAEQLAAAGFQPLGVVAIDPPGSDPTSGRYVPADAPSRVVRPAWPGAAELGEGGSTMVRPALSMPGPDPEPPEPEPRPERAEPPAPPAPPPRAASAAPSRPIGFGPSNTFTTRADMPRAAAIDPDRARARAAWPPQLHLDEADVIEVEAQPDPAPAPPLEPERASSGPEHVTADRPMPVLEAQEPDPPMLDPTPPAPDLPYAASSEPRRAAVITDELPKAGALVALATLVCVGLGAWRIGDRSLWMDEGFSWSTSNRSWSDLFDLIKGSEANGALYAVLLKPWLDLDAGEGWMRLPSAISMALVVPLLYLVGRRLLGQRDAVLAAALFAVNGSVVMFAQQVRGYALTSFVSIVCWALFVADVEDEQRTNNRRTWAWAISAVALAYCHVVAVLIPVAQLVSLAWADRPMARLRERRLQLAVWLLGIAPLAASLRGNDEIQGLLSLRLGVFRDVLYTLTGRAGIPGVVLVGVLGAVGLKDVVGQCASRRGTLEGWRGAAVVSWLFVPPVALLVVSLVHPLLIGRYLLICLPAVLLLVARGTWVVAGAVGGLARWTLPLLAVAVSLYGARWWLDRVTPEDWRSASAQVISQGQPGDVIVFVNDSVRLFTEYYREEAGVALPIAVPVYPPQPWGDYGTGDQRYAYPTEAELEAIAAQAPRIWVVVGRHHDNIGDVDAQFAVLERTHDAVQRVVYSGDVEVALFQRSG